MSKETIEPRSKALQLLHAAFEELDEFVPSEHSAGSKIASAIELLKISIADDWTRARDGRSNSSPAFDTIVAAVKQLILGQAHALIRGRVDAVARLIVAQLAHVWKLRPMEDPICRHREGDTFAVPCPRCGASTDWSGS